MQYLPELLVALSNSIESRVFVYVRKVILCVDHHH